MILRLSGNRGRQRRSKNWHLSGKNLLGLLLGLSAVCWISYKQYRNYTDQPQALLVLGGAVEREEFAAEFARKNPELEIWVSGGSNQEYAQWIFTKAGIADSRVHLDYRAVDTVTNFTTLVDEFKARGINSVYLVTSDDHMRRAQVIGEIVFGSRGITYKPLPVPSGREPEPIEKALRDGVRAIVWLTTGYTGADLANKN